MSVAQLVPFTQRSQVTLVPATPFQFDVQTLGDSRFTTRGPTVVIKVLAHTQVVRVRAYWSAAVGGPWFLRPQLATVVGVPFEAKIRMVGAAWARFEFINLGGVSTTPWIVLQEMIDLRGRA